MTKELRCSLHFHGGCLKLRATQIILFLFVIGLNRNATLLTRSKNQINNYLIARLSLRDKQQARLDFVFQDVVRNWYARFPKITVNADDLVKNAEEAAKALRGGRIRR